MDKLAAESIQQAIKKIIKELSSDAHYLEKYGGEVILPNSDDNDTFVGGIFTYKKHVSLEFSHGASFNDAKGHLEGGGKERRHLKLLSLEDIEKKDVKEFLRQALSS